MRLGLVRSLVVMFPEQHSAGQLTGAEVGSWSKDVAREVTAGLDTKPGWGIDVNWRPEERLGPAAAQGNG